MNLTDEKKDALARGLERLADGPLAAVIKTLAEAQAYAAAGRLVAMHGDVMRLSCELRGERPQ